MKKGTKIYSVLHLKCPQCHEGNLFLSRNPYNLKLFDKMPDKCEVCNENFVRETGFYWGAMMISHATTTVIAILVHSVVFVLYGWAILPNLLGFASLFLLLIPIIFRSSRAIWINLFVSYHSRVV